LQVGEVLYVSVELAAVAAAGIREWLEVTVLGGVLDDERSGR
jgi:hypothetical protein